MVERRDGPSWLRDDDDDDNHVTTVRRPVLQRTGVISLGIWRSEVRASCGKNLILDSNNTVLPCSFCFNFFFSQSPPFSIMHLSTLVSCSNLDFTLKCRSYIFGKSYPQLILRQITATWDRHRKTPAIYVITLTLSILCQAISAAVSTATVAAS